MPSLPSFEMANTGIKKELAQQVRVVLVFFLLNEILELF